MIIVVILLILKRSNINVNLLLPSFLLESFFFISSPQLPVLHVIKVMVALAAVVCRTNWPLVEATDPASMIAKQVY